MSFDFLETPLCILAVACVAAAIGWGVSTSVKSNDSARVETTKSLVEALKNPDMSPDTRKLLEKKLIESVK